MTPAGRGTAGLGLAENPAGRFERLSFEPDLEEPIFADDEPRPSPKTHFFHDFSKTILTTNESPDVGFEASINPYRGCEHGCIYCYARPTHEYLGLSAGRDFETKIFVKTDAANLLRKKISSKSWIPKLVNISGITDCYQPIERKLKITRSILEVMLEFRNPVTLITKNHLITRDLDLFRSMNDFKSVGVFITITSLDSDLIDRMEPRTSRPSFRLKAIETLANAGIPVGVLIAPVIPGLTDSEMPDILKAAASAGAQFADYVPLRLPYGLGPLFEAWLTQHFPERKEKILNRIKEIRGGKLNDPNFNSRMRGSGVFAEQLRSLFHLYSKKEKFNSSRLELSTQHFRRPDLDGQLSLFNL